MLLFCPACSNMLTITRIPAPEEGERPDPAEGQQRFECRTCPYQFKINKQYFERKEFPRKKAEDIIGGADAWKNVDKMDAQCPNTSCGNTQAFFRQVQIRSADDTISEMYQMLKGVA